MAPDVNVMMTVDGDHLATLMSGQEKLPLAAQSETAFFLKAVEFHLDFVKDASGAETQLVSPQGGQDTIVKRVSDTVGERREIV